MQDSKYDMVIDRGQADRMVADHGFAGLLESLNVLAKCKLGRGLDLYSLSTEWAWVPSVQVIKARGARGDLLVGLR